MKDGNLADKAKSVVELLTPLESANRRRVIEAAWMLLGESGAGGATQMSPAKENGGNAPPPGGEVLPGGKPTPKVFFDQKQPKSKIEELSAAARYREVHEQAEEHSKKDLEQVIRLARRNFDPKNFSADLRNAKNKGLFNKNTGNKITLSYRGQGFIDALPNREAIKPIPRVKRTPGRKAKTAK